MAVDQTFIKNLAAANGLTIPEERLDAALRQYQSFLRTIAVSIRHKQKERDYEIRSG